MQIGDLVTRNPELFFNPVEIGIIVGAEDEDEIVVVWSDGYRHTYSIYDLEVICK